MRSWISSEREDKTRLKSISRTQALWNSIEVDSTTICQCTGLKDKNGNLIWENDILYNGNYFVVKWNESCSRFDIVLNNSNNIPIGKWEPMICDWKTSDFKEYRKAVDYEVIGNVFDNPELLESEEISMARIFRFSGYLVSNRENISLEDIYDDINDVGYAENWQQLHIEQSEEFNLDGEDKPNCDLSLLTRHFKADNISTEFDRPLPKKGEKYRHFKLGKIVTVIDISRHTETEELAVVYEYEGTIWSRPLEMFMSEVDRGKYPNTTQKYRFEKVESEEK